MSDLKAKMHKIRFPLGLHPRLRWGSLQRSPVVFKGPTSKGMDSKEGEGGEEQGRRGKGGRERKRERKGKGQPPPIFWPKTVPT